MGSSKDIIYEFEKALLSLDKIETKRLLNNENINLTPNEIVSQIVVPAMERIGESWQEGNLALSQIYMSGRICETLIDELLDSSSNKRKNQPNMGIAVLDDFHFLGKRIIHSQIRSAGFEIKDYGRKTVEGLVSSIIEDKIEIIFISTLMYPSALSIKLVKEKLSDLAPKVKIIVGGAPFNMDKKLWKEVGADAMGSDGVEALKFINQIIEE